MTYHHLSTEEKSDILVDRCEAFSDDKISEKYFREELAKLGMNATDIEQHVKSYRPEPPENADGDAD